MNRRKFLQAIPLAAFSLVAAVPARTVTMTPGIHTMDTVTVPVGETWEGQGRVIITRADGKPPSVENHGTLKNVWVGGTRETSEIGGATISAFDNSVFDGVTLFGYYGGINGGSHINPRILNSRFVNCGGAAHYHPIYINNFNATEGQGATIEDNLFVGGEGYPIHLYHAPNWNSVRRNFVGGGLRCVAVEGHHNTVRDNLFWSNAGDRCAWVANENGCSNLVFNHNLFGAATTTHYLNYPADSIVKNNWFVGDAYPFGTNTKTLLKSELPEWIGITHNQIQVAVNALKYSFTLNPSLLLNDATIEPNFALLRGAVAEWAA
jgi:hypothetical protein